MGVEVEDSTVQKPSWGVFKHSCQKTQVLLLWHRNTGGGIYTIDLDGGQWVESKELLVAVKVAPAKGRAYGQRLLTSLHTIHKAVIDGKQES